MDVRMKRGRGLCVCRVHSELLAYSRRSAILSTTTFLLFLQTRGTSSAKNLFQCLAYNRCLRKKKSLRKEFSGKKMLKKGMVGFCSQMEDRATNNKKLRAAGRLVWWGLASWVCGHWVTQAPTRRGPCTWFSVLSPSWNSLKCLH